MDFEAQFFSRMGMAFEWEQTDDPAAGEAALCHHLDNGRPAIVQTDIYYLPHYSGNTHFPGHLITAWGYDGIQGVFFITDTKEKRGQVCLWPSSRLADLQNSLNPVCSGN
jgi:hypothetical protein